MTLDVRTKIWALFQAAPFTDSARSWFNERGLILCLSFLSSGPSHGWVRREGGVLVVPVPSLLQGEVWSPS